MIATVPTIVLRYIMADPDALVSPVLRSTYGTPVKAACVIYGVPEFRPYWLRHTVATQMADGQLPAAHRGENVCWSVRSIPRIEARQSS